MGKFVPLPFLGNLLNQTMEYDLYSGEQTPAPQLTSTHDDQKVISFSVKISALAETLPVPHSQKPCCPWKPCLALTSHLGLWGMKGGWGALG